MVQHSVVFGAMQPSLVLGRDAAGLLAAGLLTEADSDLDFGRGEWRLYPDGRGAREGYRELSSSIQHVGGGAGSPYIFVDAFLDGNALPVPARYRHAGPGDALAARGAAKRAVERCGPYAPGRVLRHRRRRRACAHRPRRRSEDRRFRLRAPAGLRSPTVVAASGAISPTALSASAFSSCSNLSTDVRRHRLWAQPSGRPQRPERYRLTGIWVDERGDALEITDLSPRSPAADAGLQRGDQIIGLSWRSSPAGRRPPGRRFELNYRRGGETRTTRLTLREFLSAIFCPSSLHARRDATTG